MWQATDTQLNRQVALKILPDAFAEDPDRLARFQREAQVLASLNHPGIAQIHGIEEAEGTRALVLELVEGPTLADRIAQGPIPVDEALLIAKQIAEALEAAHEQGVIHRDLKPANIKLRPDGTVKVLDFGLAKALDTAPEGDPSQSPTLTAAATQMGVIMGTAAYMSPEQARGKPVDKRADIWAFGAVLFEMLTGQRPFQGEDVSLTLSAVLQREPDWAELPDSLPLVLSKFLRACLEKNPRQRIGDIRDLRLAMEGAFEVPALPVPDPVPAPVLRVWQQPGAVAAMIMAALVVGGAVVWSLTRATPPVSDVVARFPVPLAPGQSFVAPGDSMVAISRDGLQVIYQANESLWLRRVDQLEAVEVSGSEGGREPFFSPDGQAIGFWAGDKLRRVAVGGGPSVILTDLANPGGVSWGDDDMILAAGPDGVVQVPGAGGEPQLVVQAAEGEEFLSPRMLPGGEWVLMTVRGADHVSWDEAQVVAQSITTGERTVLVDGGRDARYVSTGHLVYGLDGVLFAVPFDVTSHEVIGGPVPLVEEVRRGRTVGVVQYDVSATGSLVYVSGSPDETNLVSLVWVSHSGEEEVLSAPPRPYGHPRVSPDGTQVAVDIADADGSDVWIWDLEEEFLAQLTFHEADDDRPLWTPDGERVAFQSLRDGGGVFWKAADGSGPVERLKEGAATPYAWSSDGRLVFEQGADIGVLSLDGEQTVEMLLEEDYLEFNPALSPDGSLLAYHTDAGGATGLFVRSFPNVKDSQWRVAGNGRHPVWSPNGREVFFRGPGGADLMVARIETSPSFRALTPEPLFSLRDYLVNQGRQYDISPDGDRFIFRKPLTSARDAFNGLIYVGNWSQELLDRVPVP